MKLILRGLPLLCILAGLTFLVSQAIPVKIPIPANDPDVARLRAFMEIRRLKWEISVGASGINYCASSYIPPSINTDPHSYHVECAHSLKSLTNTLIADYTDNKLGVAEDVRNGHRPLVQGEPATSSSPERGPK